MIDQRDQGLDKIKNEQYRNWGQWWRTVIAIFLGWLALAFVVCKVVAWVGWVGWVCSCPWRWSEFAALLLILYFGLATIGDSVMLAFDMYQNWRTGRDDLLRKEGREEGIQKGREEERQRILAGVADNPQAKEAVEKVLNGH